MVVELLLAQSDVEADSNCRYGDQTSLLYVFAYGHKAVVDSDV